MWVARDKNGRLYLYKNKPIKRLEIWNGSSIAFITADEDLFSEVQWKDNEPTEVELIVKMKNLSSHDLYNNKSLS